MKADVIASWKSAINNLLNETDELTFVNQLAGIGLSADFYRRKALKVAQAKAWQQLSWTEQEKLQAEALETL